jgi:hypothetical protein
MALQVQEVSGKVKFNDSSAQVCILVQRAKKEVPRSEVPFSVHFLMDTSIPSVGFSL